jgi:hypothetical protein
VRLVPPPRAAGPLRPPARSRSGVLAALAAGLVVSASGAAWFAFRGDRPASPAEPARPFEGPLEAAPTGPARAPEAAPAPTPAPHAETSPRTSPPRTASRSLPAPRDDGFVDAMSAGLAALERGAWDDAKRAFGRAAATRPDAPEAADGMARAEQGARLAAIALHRERAAAAAVREDWRAAAAEHEAALALDPALAFAQEGRAQALALAALHAQLELHVARPERLGADEVAREAERALQRAREEEKPGPRLRERIAGVERALAAARVPVRVVLRSDGRTELTVLRVGRLGPLQERALELKPGTYTVTGSRPGFRDVRRTLVVEPGRSPAPLDVRCTEAL